MKISVAITSEEYNALTRHAASSSPVSHALATAAILSHLDGDGISQTYEITCNDIEARALLALARAHCPSAGSKITAALTDASRDPP